MKILVIGGVSYDSIIYLDKLPNPVPNTIFSSDFHETVASTGTGKALNLANLGFDVTFHGLIGNDEYGEKIKTYFQNTKINFIYDFVNETERHTNIMDKEGQRLSIYTTYSSTNPTINLDVLEKEIRSCDLVVLNIIDYARYLIPLIKKHNKPIWTDLHDYDGNNPYHQDFIIHSDYLFLSSEKLNSYKVFMKQHSNKELIVCTHGKKGATACKNKTFYEESILSTYQVIDTNGAGDSFFSGFLYGYINKKPINNCMRFGTICAGLCITTKEVAYHNLTENYLLKEYTKHYHHKM